MHEKVVVGSRWSLFAVVAEARFYCNIGKEKCYNIIAENFGDVQPQCSLYHAFIQNNILKGLTG